MVSRIFTDIHLNNQYFCGKIGHKLIHNRYTSEKNPPYFTIITKLFTYQRYDRVFAPTTSQRLVGLGV